jgi:segregation and condensation protein A
MSQILRRSRTPACKFTELFDPARGVAVLVVTLLALLELARELLIDITQSGAFAPIYVRIAYAESP